LAFALIIIITKLFTVKDFKWKFFYVIYFLTGLSNLFINGGRTGQVALLFSIFAMSLLYFRNSYKILISSVITIVATLLFAYNFSPNFHERVSQLETDISNMYVHNDFHGSVATRIALWIVGTESFLDNPLLGSGIGGEMINVPLHSEKYGFDHTSDYSDFHNTFIQYAVQLGIFGLLVPILVFYTLFTLKFQTRQYQLLATSFGIIFLLHSMGGFTFHIMNPLVLLCTFATLFNAISYRENNPAV
jgi:O-antigen ligase